MINFEYATYKLNTFDIPLSILVFFFFSIITTCIINLPKIKKQNKKDVPLMVVSTILGSIIGGFILTMISIQFSYGVRLVKYGEKDPVYISGEIQEITEVPFWRYRDDNNHPLPASWIKINDEKYYIMAIGNFKVGDTVQIKYLNKSNFVLSIDYFNRESETNIEANILIE